MTRRDTRPSPSRDHPRLVVLHLYPTLMNVYGDRGNVISLIKRCQWRGIEVEVIPASLGERLDPRAFDLVFFGGGQDHEQSAVGADLMRYKAGALREAIEDGAALLAVCGGYQLLGHFFRTRDGHEIRGIGLFDAWTQAGPRRHIGNIVLQSDLGGAARTLVGFENHSGQTFLGSGVRPLGTVIIGAGNNGQDRTEGAIYRNAIGCYLHGPVLPKNPWLADWLIERALERRHGKGIRLPSLDDRLEEQAHAAIEQRARQLRSQRSGAW